MNTRRNKGQGKSRDKDKGRRIFFSLQPDETACAALVRAQAAIAAAGRRMAPENLHVTLAFLGVCDVALEDCAHVAAMNIRGAHDGAFPLRLDLCGYFERPRIVHVYPEREPPELASLHRALWGGLRRCDLCAPRTFRPHLTLFRGVTRAPTPSEFAPAEWRVRSFCMVESQLHEKGARYTVLHEYPL